MKSHYMLGLPFITVEIYNKEIDALVDTGFDGAVSLPNIFVNDLALLRMGIAEYVMADGSLSTAEIFLGKINWLEEIKEVEIISSPNDIALVGMELLFDSKTTIIPANGILTIEKP